MTSYEGIVLGGISPEKIDSIKSLGNRFHATPLSWERDVTGLNYKAEFSVEGDYMKQFVKRSLNSGYASYVSYLPSEADRKKIDNYIM